MSTYRVCACIDMDAFRHNIKEIRKHIQNNAGFMGVVKANAYGHGAVLWAGALRRKVPTGWRLPV